MTSDASSRIKSSGFVSSGSWSKLGAGLCLALLAAYGVLWGSTVQARGGPDRYVRLSDFLFQLTGANILAGPHPERLYDLAEQQAVQERLIPAGQQLSNLLPFNHPPFVALTLEPLVSAGLPVQMIFTLWTLVSAAAAGISLGLLAAAWPPRRSASWLLMLASTSFFPLIVALMQGQVSPLLLLGWAGGSVALKMRRDVAAGMILALAALKPQTLPLLLLALLVMGRWRALLSFTVTVTAASVLIMPFVGADWPLRYARFLADVMSMLAGGSLAPDAMQNLRGLLSEVFGATAGSTLSLVALLVALVMVALLWWRRKNDGAAVQDESTDWDLRWALTLMLAVVTSLYAFGHDLTPVIVPAWIIATKVANGGIPARRQVAWTVWLWLGYALGLAGGLPELLPGHPAVLWLIITCGALYMEIGKAHRTVPAAVMI